MTALTDGEFTVLGLLVERPRHGYELERVIEERGVRAWTSLGFSSIYYVLDKLAGRGLIEAVGGPARGKSRAVFRATAPGLAACADAVRGALADAAPMRSRVLIAMANSAVLPDAEVAAGLALRLEALRARLAEVRAARAAQEPLPAGAAAVFDHSEAMLAADLGWTEATRAVFTEESMMDKYDVKKARRDLYAPTAKAFTVVDVPEMRYLAVDGHGDPNTSPEYADAVEALYGTAYTLKFASKRALRRDFTVAPMEGLWRADDPAAFAERDKSAWSWTMMIGQPDWITEAMVRDAVAAVAEKRDNPALAGLRLFTFTEGTCVQILHVGSYDDEGPVLERLHREYMPANGYEFNGDHHEIYLSDARRTAPAKLKTVLRQPVRPV
ncbi:GyrI-like domain-containing protein [Glycomyces sp. A-F 0318]|uniref:GyrI-like domain-containing protein n=1 Tax=Glycomyces amatae TaxID=2881355 RepID=UPI001E33290E|nr:GyrI-like domain-containing protein [Glycomyces amatae]MCD0443362.1 GyrI-like domain-containing protein [Glycomyces amatae]